MTSQFVSSLLSTINKILGVIRQPARDGLKEDIRKLERKLRRVQATIEEVEHREIYEETVKLWLQELKCLACDAEDVLDEYQYELLRCQLEVKQAPTATTSGKFADMVYNSESNSAIVNHASSCFSESILMEMTEKLRQINVRFSEISRDREALRLTDDEGKRREISSSINLSSTSHLMNKDGTFGRSDDKNKIINLLLRGILWDDDTVDQLLVIPILGMGGIGKTTLAKMVYGDPFVESLFDVRGWVYVSPEFDIIRLTKEISEFVIWKPGGSFVGLSRIQEEIQKKLEGKKMLLVLDDVWNVQQNDWEMLFLPLRIAKLVRVLVTSRNDAVAQAPHTVTPHRLLVLPEHECWKLFQYYAFGGKKMEENSWSVEIGRQIIKKCGGLPLAVKCIGGALHYNKDENSWREILDSELWKSDELDPVFRALKVSYYHLPPKLRDCFLFCSLFPKGSRLKKIEIIYMWMAHGLLQPMRGKLAEDLGEDYFDELQMRSFISLGRKGSFILHDVIYDLARSLSLGEIHTIIDEKSTYTPDEVRHLYIRKGNFPSQSFKPHRLRTLFNADLMSIDCSINLCDIRSVRVLGLIGSNVHALAFPSCWLKQLRYLGIKEIDLEKLPEPICLLYHLQTLKISHCYNLRELPTNISDLVNLRYLHIAQVGIKELPETLCQLPNLQRLHLVQCDNLRVLPLGISKLINLQILRLKSCKHLMTLPSDIGNLKNLKHLDLSFSGIRVLPDSLALLLQPESSVMGHQEVTTVHMQYNQDWPQEQDTDDEVVRQTIPCMQKPVMVCFARSPRIVVDIGHFSGYDELRRHIARLFDVEELLTSTITEGLNLMYEREGDGNLRPIGSEKWKDFVRSVRLLKISRTRDLEDEVRDSFCEEWKAGDSCTGSHLDDGAVSESPNTWMSSHDSTAVSESRNTMSLIMRSHDKLRSSTIP